ncbi:MAG: hypothetical protein IPO01_03235 [Chitinophagaceae bacterium]|nr:hypothetical protein [Chitinophagaceae bacterium]MBK7305700.1 hypothetical protein [Chitinophagaceae bacterium]MBK8519669.1 hypothetical protein [Chitinophagaceae bacterium]MBK8785059.1 hypothetical protein [Chitinophagaceae bacterium]MBK9484256.1 hypothetical protein [Chitinophagaceae bacterium]
MTSKKDIHQLIEDLIQKERNTEANPFLSTRIMAAIEKKNFSEVKQVSPVWKTAVVAFSLVAAVFSGVAAGSLYQTKNTTPDVVVMNDDRMENFVFYNEIGNE